MARVRALHTAIALGVTLALSAPVAAEPTTEELDRRMRRMENILDSGQLADLIQRTSELEREIRELRGELETQDHRMDELRERQRNLYGDLDRRIRALEVAGAEADESGDDGNSGNSGNGDGSGNSGADAGGASAGSSASVAGGDTSEAGSGGESASDPNAEREAYDAAFGLLKDGRYSEAASAFADFVEKYPKGPYADNAQYWLGESRYVTREFEAALNAFRKVVSDYPDSAKVPDASLKIGYSLYELERLDEAREALEKVTQEHGNSAVARLAEERLLKIKEESG
jgi:tol-pal system protein YbgF